MKRIIRTFILRPDSDGRGEGLQSHIEWNAYPTLLGGFIMSCGNPFNHLLKNVKGSFLNRELFSTSKPKYDDVIECMQFGICSSKPRRMKDIPYFLFLTSSYLNSES